jgi:hypothetical protein
LFFNFASARAYRVVKRKLARPTRFERVTFAFGGQRSLYAASRGTVLSINRKNRVLRAPATTDPGDIKLPSGPATERRSGFFFAGGKAQERG